MRAFIVTAAIVFGACATEFDTVEQQLPNDQCWCDIETGERRCQGSPVVFDMAGDGYQLTGAHAGVPFALHEGRERLWSWTGPSSDDAWLVLDIDGDGLIETGAEMFGDATIQPIGGEPNGFAALAFHDAPQRGGNGDGRINAADAVYRRLRLWTDRNHDGVSQPAEMVGLESGGVMSVSLMYRPLKLIDDHRNEFRYSTMVETAPGTSVSPVVYDVWLWSVGIARSADPAALNDQGPPDTWGCRYACMSYLTSTTTYADVDACALPACFNIGRHDPRFGNMVVNPPNCQSDIDATALWWNTGSRSGSVTGYDTHAGASAAAAAKCRRLAEVDKVADRFFGIPHAPLPCAMRPDSLEVSCWYVEPVVPVGDQEC